MVSIFSHNISSPAFAAGDVASDSMVADKILEVACTRMNIITQAKEFCEDEGIPKWFGVPFILFFCIIWKIKAKIKGDPHDISGEPDQEG